MKNYFWLQMKMMLRKKILLLAFAVLPIAVCAQQTTVDTVQAPKENVLRYAEQMPEFPGGEKILMKYLQLNISYPEDARAAGVEGKVIAQFIVNEDGSISDIKIIRGVFPSCDSEVIAILNTMPNWRPGMQNGVPVKVYFILPVTFKLNETDYNKPNITLPSYPAGDDSLAAFVKRNIQYPKLAKKNKVQGVVTLSFNVDSVGKSSDVVVYKSVGSGCDEEATRILKLIPLWNPGTKQGEPVKMPYYMMVEFKLPEKK